ncbi:MAG: hypothetical protein H7281_16865 [Bacteriovorax sp.]|nr:hypothetical protein [Bacteriovorax sp.]
MNTNSDRKDIAKDKLHVAIDNFKQAELEGAEELAPETYKLAKVKIYENRKIILNPSSDEQSVEEAADDASAASAQLISAVRKKQNRKEFDLTRPPEVVEKEAINNLVNEGGPVP